MTWSESLPRSAPTWTVSHASLTADSSQNGLQEYAIADIGALGKIPNGIIDDQAATLPVNLMAAVIGLLAL